MSQCPAVLLLYGQTVECDWPVSDGCEHDGWAHGNLHARAIWTEDRTQLGKPWKGASEAQLLRSQHGPPRDPAAAVERRV